MTAVVLALSLIIETPLLKMDLYNQYYGIPRLLHIENLTFGSVRDILGKYVKHNHTMFNEIISAQIEWIRVSAAANGN